MGVANGIKSLRVGRQEAAEYLGITIGVLDGMVERKEITADRVGDEDGARTHLRFTVSALSAARKTLREKRVAERALLKESKQENGGDSGNVARLMGAVGAIAASTKELRAQVSTFADANEQRFNTLCERIGTLQESVNALLDAATAPKPTVHEHAAKCAKGCEQLLN
jgi:hypothetical protein